MNQFLDLYNIRRSTRDVEYHPLKPFLKQDTTVMFLGSFPPQRKRWCIDFFYPNFINDHWRIQGLVFYGDKNHFVDSGKKQFKINEILRHCEAKRLGFYDTAYAVRRLADNASDKFLQVVKATNMRKCLVKTPNLKAIVTTGTKATEIICCQFGIQVIPQVNECVELTSDLVELNENKLLLFRLPSSSRAYPLALEKKAEAYANMFRRLGIIV